MSIQPLPQNNDNPNRRLTIAFFGSAPGGLFNFEKWQMWRGIADAARTAEINIIYVAGEEITHTPDSILYDLISLQQVDGIICWGVFSNPNRTNKQVNEFLGKFAHIPKVSIDLPVKGCSNVQFNVRQGLNATLDHLINAHCYRKIAFVAEKSHHSEDRRQIFIELMKERGLYESCLVGDLPDLEACGLVPGKDYEAVIADSDVMAVEVIESLRAQGIQVPEDVAVTGFNDGQESRGVIPPLTTIRLPFRWAGHRAVEMLVERIKSGSKPKSESIETYLILRRSCGCLEPMAEEAAAPPLLLPEISLPEMLAAWRGRIIEDLSGSMGTWISLSAKRWAESLLDLFLSELTRPVEDQFSMVASKSFLYALNILLRDALAEGSNISRWHGAVTTLRRYLLGYLDQPKLRYAEDLMQQMRVLIAQTAVRAEIHQTWHLTQRTEILREIESDLLLSLDLSDLLSILSEGLSRLGIGNFYLVLYGDGQQQLKQSRLMFASEDGRMREGDIPIIFPAGDILPAGLLSPERSHHLVIEALSLRNEQLGYIVFDSEPPDNPAECDIFQALRLQLSSALKGVRLRKQLQDALVEAEEANQLKSRFLSMVSHELRTPLNLIVGLSEMAMRQQARGKKASNAMLRKFNEQIYVSGQHLDRLIRDVLDLASSQVGQMALMRKPLDILPVLKDTANMGEQLAQQKNLIFRTDLPERLPLVDGDKTRLRQVLLNLISNAVKFTAHGEVVLSASQENGLISISVKDTGLGIAKDEQERIFDEFQQTDRSMVRGYGGIGLGLAITRRLVELHGGKIWVTSEGALGSGSTFLITLPILQQAFDESASLPSLREGKVLILTKDEHAVNDLRKHLIKNGFVVEELIVQEQPDFLELLLNSPPGAVVLDFAPASEQGWEIMRKLKENPTTQDVPVLFFSLMIEQNAGSVLEMDYLAKPVGTEQLISALRRHGLMNRAKSGGGKVLIVDDEPGILDLHTRMVENELPDCQVLQAKDGLQGLDLMRRELPDLVLLDLMMPELDGFGVLRLMQEEPSLRGIPVIVLSAQVLTRRDLARLNQGVAAVLGKGLFTTEEIMTRIQGVLARTGRLGGEGQRLVHQAMAYFHEHFNEPISRADVANFLSVNEQYLSRCFNRELGIGPMGYLSRFRIEQAKRLLEKGTFTITQVALEVGLSSQSYFSRLFYQETGITPSAYLRGERSGSK